MNTPIRVTLTTVVLAALLSMISERTYGEDHIQLFKDKEDWDTQVGEFQTIDFTGFPQGTLVTDQYADLGVNFAGNTIIIESQNFLNDGWGIFANGGSWMHFDEPMNWIAGDHTGRLFFALYSGDTLIGEAGWPLHSGAGNFTGVISEVAFDSVFLFRPPTHDGSFTVFVDDLHFGALVPAPGALGLLGLALLFTSRRRPHHG